MKTHDHVLAAADIHTRQNGLVERHTGKAVKAFKEALANHPVTPEHEPFAHESTEASLEALHKSAREFLFAIERVRREYFEAKVGDVALERAMAHALTAAMGIQNMVDVRFHHEQVDAHRSRVRPAPVAAPDSDLIGLARREAL